MQSLLNAITAEYSYRGWCRSVSAAKYDSTRATKLKSEVFDVETLSTKGRRYEELDQMVNELLLGVRTTNSAKTAERAAAATRT